MNQTLSLEPSSFSIYLQQALRPIRKRYLKYSYVNNLPVETDYKLLDYGSGIGIMAELFAKRIHDGEITCVDISGRYMDKAKQNLRSFNNVSFHHGQLNNLNSLDTDFDAINIHNVLYQIPPSDRELLIFEMYHILKPGGKIYIKEPLKDIVKSDTEEIQELFLNSGFIPVYEKHQKSRIWNDSFTACYSKLSRIKFFLA
jgi:ubiquinone/menaquinone biosynthesis C-methylase UbiE